MVEWSELIGKEIFVRLTSNSVFNGKISEVVDSGDNLIWIHLIDKFGKLVVFLPKEIAELKVK